MRKIYLIALVSLLANLAFGQQKIQIHNSGNTMYARELTDVDSIKLDGTYAKFKLSDNANTLNIQKTLIDSLTFTTDTVNLDKIYIIYNGNDNATIINPYAASGVSITANAGTVVVTAASGIDNLEYNLLGSSANGSLELNTDKDINLVLNNLTLSNPSGAPISITGQKTTTFSLSAGTTNTLSDGASSTRNGTITTDGPVVIANSGTLNITAVKKHGINTSSTITINNGTTMVVSATSDGFHSEGFAMTGGIATITSLADGIDTGNGAITIDGGTINVTSTTADVKAIKTGNNTIIVTGGNINLTISGAQSKGISAKGDITFNGGNITENISGIAVLTAEESGFNPSYATGVKSDGTITVNGNTTFNITQTASANGSKGFSSDAGIVINGGNFTINTAGTGAVYTNTSGAVDSYTTACFSTDTDITISGGTFNLTVSGSGEKDFLLTEI
ncbi:carbohydrate-binding domain-containing protein [Flavobacterium sp. 3HN19-14]|uniref:carbohydrate-binding domain-containing protein n=1 Tax=Flavobacterium sp. 3HN19-14 TaxID=3448133 RepID=UPI003EE14673